MAVPIGLTPTRMCPIICFSSRAADRINPRRLAQHRMAPLGQNRKQAAVEECADSWTRYLRHRHTPRDDWRGASECRFQSCVPVGSTGTARRIFQRPFHLRHPTWIMEDNAAQLCTRPNFFLDESPFNDAGNKQHGETSNKMNVILALIHDRTHQPVSIVGTTTFRPRPETLVFMATGAAGLVKITW